MERSIYQKLKEDNPTIHPVDSALRHLTEIEDMESFLNIYANVLKDEDGMKIVNEDARWHAAHILMHRYESFYGSKSINIENGKKWLKVIEKDIVN